ncbi:hypothetical protein Pcinc_008121 [Petrolisthes cinctipes]|uniref:Uncharacterized protein n=1 Tax=Petrolisthes cinctipes TaxID=88211 RepID=A0AAE1GDX7_PETCI|nr:hypothetical protein Pcinc_008121 [Petrolisthes cinctipes]
MYYSREGEKEDLFIPGPLKIPLTLMLLFQTENPGLRWEYTLAHENATYTPTFSWHHSDWSVCTVTCGGGRQVSRVQCLEKEAGLVEDKYCQEQERPNDLSRACNTHACPAWWWSGPWQPCSITCGVLGMMRRTVICVRSFGPSEQMALLDSACDNNAKPHETEACPNLMPCPRLLDWSVGSWSQSCMLDPCEYEEREVTCVMPGGGCDPLTRPPARRQCGNITCGVWEVDEWSMCSAECGEGVRFRRVSCVGGLACLERNEPKSVQECTGRCLEKEQEEEEETLFEEAEEILKGPSSPTTVTATTATTASSTSGTTIRTTKTTISTTESSDPLTSESTSATSSTSPASTSSKNVNSSETFPTGTIPTMSTTTAPLVTSSTSSTTSLSNTITTSAGPSLNTTTATLTPDVDTRLEDDLNVTSFTSPFLPTTTTSTTILTSNTSSATSTSTTTTPTSITSSGTTVSDLPFSKAASPSSTTEELASEYATVPPSESENLEDTTSVLVDSNTTMSSPTWTEPYTSNTEEPDTSTDTLVSTLLPTDQYQVTTTPEESNDYGSSDEENVLTATTTTPEEARGTETETESDIGHTTVTTVDETDNTVNVDEKYVGNSAETVSDSITTSIEKSEDRQKNFTDISQGQEAANEIDVDSRQEKPQKKNEKLSLPAEEPNKESDFTSSVQNNQGISTSPDPTKKDQVNTNNDDSSPESKADDNILTDNDLFKSTKKYPTLENPKNEETNEIESTWLEDVETEIDKSEEIPDDTNRIFPDLEEVEETRPEGIMVDKVDIDGYEVIEVVELPPKGKGKKKRKKVLLHTGAEAVDVLHKLAEEQEEKLASNLGPTSEYTPDYQWNLTQWSECSVECGGGEQERSVQCLEQTTGVPVLPDRCSHPRPHTIQECNVEECGEWETREWGECSAECDVGERVRMVVCPSGRLCPSTTRPPEVEPCNLSPCVQWVEGPWSLCTRTCGVGYQIRHVKCVDIRTEEPAHTCPKDTKPQHKMACHNQRCSKHRRGEGRRGQQRRCKDRLDTKLCRRLKHMCSTKFFRVKCCRTCLRRGGYASGFMAFSDWTDYD